MAQRVNSFAGRIQKSGQTHSMELILFPVMILFFVGIVANNFASSAILSTPVLPTPTCVSTLGGLQSGVYECTPTNNNGCDASVHNCNFTSATTFSFLSPNSPFTALLDGNVQQFASIFTAASQTGNPTSQPFSFFPNATAVSDQNTTSGNTFFVGCLNDNDTRWNIMIFSNDKLNCWQVYTNGQQINQSISKLRNGALPPAPNTANLNCTTFNTSVTTFTYQFIGCDNIRDSLFAPTFVLAYNSTTILNAPNSGNASKTGVVLNGWAWEPNEQNVLPFSKTNSNSMQVCADIPSASISYGVGQTTSCQAASTSVHQTICSTAAGSAACNQSTGVGAFLLSVGLIAGIVFLILGLGLGLNIGIFTAAFGITSNAQGTKLMQALGIGLITWTFMYSEFGSVWLPALPFNFGTIGFLGLTTTFFLGLYWRLFAFD